MGGDHGPAEVVPGALDYARAHPARHRHPRRRRGGHPVPSPATLPANVAHRPRQPRSSAWTSTRRSPCARRRTRSILVATDLVKRGEADAVVTAGHTGRGDGRRGPAPRPPAGRRPPGARRPDDHRRGRPFVLLDIGANPDSTAENLAQYARMGAIFAERVLGVRPAARRAAVDRRGEGQGRRPDPAGDRAARRDRPATSSGNVEGKDLTRHLADVVVCDAVARQRRDQVLRGPVRRSSSTCCGPSSRRRSAAGSRTC